MRDAAKGEQTRSIKGSPTALMDAQIIRTK